MYNPADFYIDYDTVPDIFKQADRKVAEEHKDDPNIVNKTKEIPMPFVTGPSSHKQVFVTEDWYVKKKKKKAKHMAMERKDAHTEIIELLMKKDRIKHKMSKLDPTKKKDSKKLLKNNVKLNDIDTEIQVLEKFNNIDAKEVEKGSRGMRLYYGTKRVIHKKVHKLKKKLINFKDRVCGWFKRNRKDIMDIVLMCVPVIAPMLVKGVSALMTKVFKVPIKAFA